MKRVIIGSLLLTISQWYAFFLFSQFSFIIFNEFIGLSIFIMGFISRALGSILFGYIGDKISRRTALLLTGITLIISSLIVLIPSIFIVFISRILQGLSLGGEWGGASTVIIETYSTHRLRGTIASIIQLSVPIAIILSSSTLLLIFLYSIPWRESFLIITVLTLIALPLIKGVNKEKMFSSKIPLFDAILNDWKNILKSISIKVSESAAFYVFSAYIFSLYSNLKELPIIVLEAIIFQLFTMPLFGFLSDIIGRRLVVIIGLIIMGVGSYLLSLKIIYYGEIVMSISDSALYAPQSSIFTEIFNKKYRFTAANFSYQLASILGGALAPLLISDYPNLFIFIMLSYITITCIGVYFIEETKGKGIV
ncbi:MFS transporter [Sulfurisphaera ohwakuensis]|uniref:MFS family permease n=1 Tax=Sulfurisphaera ohwakuensis TaxID=69656 RepID=A0A650CDW5_SULOH|nr:MFS transporter [Sulfurisphaera ohwakuensis]MBB5253109.1 MFS family permease [Sulfurisphaera ohwakuensis]QGR15972.1 MFS transporter [Sulfurisphaera ohwakuensis]